MPVPPRNPDAGQTVWRKTRLGVYVSADHETAPTTEDWQPHWHVLGITEGVNNALPVAMFSVDLAEVRSRIGDERLGFASTKRIQVWTLKDRLTHPAEDPRSKCLFDGELVQHEPVLSAAGGLVEKRLFVARVLPYHFGNQILGQTVYNHTDGDTKLVHFDLEFNPEWEGRIVANALSGDSVLNPYSFPLWIDPESASTDIAAENYHETPVTWTLDDAVSTLCGLCNADETWVNNPDSESVEDRASASPALKNAILARGQFLPDYLSALLPPYGCGWFLKLRTDGRREIVIYRRGEGAEKHLYLQPFGEDLDLGKSNVNDLRVLYDVGSLSNKVIVQGALKQREVTVELVRGWDEDDDPSGLNNADSKSSPFRLWVGNEGGDYKGRRSEIPDDPPDLFGGTVPKKRNMQDCLTYAVDLGDSGQRERLRPVVEYSTDDRETWHNILSLNTPYQLLSGEIGVRFVATTDDSTQALPDELMETDPASLRIRITCTITDDERIEHETEVAPASPNGNTVPKYIDGSTKFFDRARQSSGDYASVLTGSADTRDDSSAIEAYADAILEAEKAANVRAPIRLPGIVLDYSLGDIVVGVKGRNLSFNRLAPWTGERYLQVVGREFHNGGGNQYTVLRVEPYDRESSHE